MRRLTPDSLFDRAHLSSDLAQRSARGGVVTLVSQGVQFFLRIAGMAILSRLLTPSDFGLVGMVTVVVNFAQMFKDAGLSMATIQKERISHEQVSTLFWFNILISAFLGSCVLICSPLVAWFYGKPALTGLTAALSCSFIISGLAIQHQALLQRHMQFGMLASIQIVSNVVNLIVTIGLALLGWRHWALVGGTLATALSGALLTLYFCPWIPGRMRCGTGVRDMLLFGGYLTGFNFVNYFARNMDSILIGRYMGADALGLYARAYQLFMMPISQIRDPLNQVALPALSALKEQPDRYARYYQRLLDVMALLTMPLTMYCAIEADFLIHMLLGPKWLGAIPIFRILALAGLIQAIASTRGLVLLSCGFSRRYFYWGLFHAIICVGSFVAGLPFGIAGVAAAYTIVNYVILFPSLFYCFPKTPITIALFMKALVPPLLTSGIAAVGTILMKSVWAHDSIMAHALYASVFLTVYTGLSWCRRSIREIPGLIANRPMAGSQRARPGFIYAH